MSQSKRASNVPVVAVVLAAGFGTRFDPNNPKQLVAVGGKPIVCWSIEAFESNPRVTDIIVVVNPTVRTTVERLIDDAGYPKVRMIIDGGAERVDSTAAALGALADAGIPADAKILIHDAVRPFVEQSSIDGCIDALDELDAATVAYASTDTVLLTEFRDGRKIVRQVPDRPHTFRAQTPQAFRFDTIRHAYELASADPGFHPTDDTRVVVDYLPESSVAVVDGSESNLKITTLADLPIAERIARQRLGGVAGTTVPADVDALTGADDRAYVASPGQHMTREEAKARMHAIFAEAAHRMR
ncbi:2-C-methyl-D-erythritol 4-phosphate cytidylyltransferase [Bifidobacterium ramosum]|uniref:2-C-methyl-D-erythritol 4-phosphate cytidylyltransferase n=1 Tax=Bifidobacterium ramosum TaxID=1798158 RepID=A0A6L4WXC0_9BIFI|nr:IspD/TarI family cytidylyltransferase [Bifidobacterium ramosum]KAB8286664.1 2-C-methyl-D-erythritol 4-phosphate cytidylyltransferase [Bifidobacterium ramosum]NEG71715.1 NTP transferase domain-containing protein [Bifidobacterium ramosum]